MKPYTPAIAGRYFCTPPLLIYFHFFRYFPTRRTRYDIGECTCRLCTERQCERERERVGEMEEGRNNPRTKTNQTTAKITIEYLFGKHRLLCAKLLFASLLGGACRSRVDYMRHAPFTRQLLHVSNGFLHLIVHPSNVLQTTSKVALYLENLWRRNFSGVLRHSSMKLIKYFCTQIILISIPKRVDIFLSFQRRSGFSHNTYSIKQRQSDPSQYRRNIIRSGLSDGSLTGKYSLITF